MGKYAHHAIWNLDRVPSDLQLVEKCLSEKAGFQKVEKLEDDRVSKDAVASEILGIARSLAGKDNLVLVY